MDGAVAIVEAVAGVQAQTETVRIPLSPPVHRKEKGWWGRNAIGILTPWEVVLRGALVGARWAMHVSFWVVWFACGGIVDCGNRFGVKQTETIFRGLFM